ncbi:MAG: hypothetical protein OXR66_08495 [Candidatus Woesearchaeota archaeon]|nr:hypothetical protein [Candidatus Woesearchaeota archaeon]
MIDALGERKVRWVASNQAINAPLVGLDVRPGERIGAVTGTGDILFNLIVAGALVESADSDPEQTAYVRRKRENVVADDQESFLYEGITESKYSTQGQIRRRHSHFSDPNIWQRLRQNIGNLRDPELADIGDFLSTRNFDKAFLSNAPGWGYTGETESGMLNGRIDCNRIFDACAQSLPQGGLAYRVRFARQWFLGTTYENFESVPSLAQKAAVMEEKIGGMWIPEVYRRI